MTRVKQITDASFDADVKVGISIIDFWAEWCGPCKAIAPTFEALSEEFKEVKFFKMNVDENQQIPSEFGIRSIPTFIAFKNGEKIATKVGGMSKSEFAKWIGEIK